MSAIEIIFLVIFSPLMIIASVISLFMILVLMLAPFAIVSGMKKSNKKDGE